MSNLDERDEHQGEPNFKKLRSLSEQKRKSTETPQHDSSRSSSSDSEWEEDVDSQDTADWINCSIGGTITRLLRLSNAIRKSASAARNQRIATYAQNNEVDEEVAELAKFTECYVAFRYPEANATLRTRLVEANCLRRRRLLYQTSHRKRLAGEQPKPMTPATIVDPEISTSMLSQNLEERPKSISNQSARLKLPQSSMPPRSETRASTAIESRLQSIYAKSSLDRPRAQSVIQNSRLSFPPVPTSDDCPYCGAIIEYREEKDAVRWR